MADWERLRRSVDLRKMDDEDKAKGTGAIMMISFIVAFSAAIVVFFAQQSRTGDFYVFAEYGLGVLQLPTYMEDLTLASWLIGLGLFVSTFCLSVAGLNSCRRFMKFSLFLVLAFSGLCIAGGAYTLSFINGLASVSSVEPVLEGVERELQDFAVAVYDTCCFEAGLIVNPAAEGFGGSLTADDVRWDDITLCSEFFDDPETTRDDILTEICVGNRLHVQYFEKTVTDNICSTLNSTKVNIKGQSLGSISLEQLTRGRGSITIVGPANSPEYGCGGGKVKSFMYIVYLWGLTTTRPLALSMIILGVINVMLVLLGVASLGLSSGSDVELSMAVINAYMQQQQQQQTNSHVSQSVQSTTSRSSSNRESDRLSKRTSSNRASVERSSSNRRASKSNNVEVAIPAESFEDIDDRI